MLLLTSKMDSKFLDHYQKNYFQSAETPEKLAEKQRQCIAQLYNASCDKLDNNSACFLLETKLNEYSKTVQNRGENIFIQRIDKLLAQRKEPLKQAQIDPKLLNLDLFIKKLDCSGQINCTESENVSLSEFEEFRSLFDSESKLRKTGTKSLQAQNEAFNANKQKLSNVKLGDNCFKTAGEELKIQSLKKFGSSSGPSTTNGGGGGLKRSLGLRRNVNSKFVSPLLTKTESKENVLEENTETDERLKHIEPKMIELIRSEIMDCGTTITWNDIAGLNFAKTAIQEAVVWPMLRPDIFKGLRRPPKGILLFGPPGTGKTLIGKCVACQSESTFFSISASSLTSKWIGDGEKMVRALFAVARVHQPSVIFIDEIDSLLCQRSETEHESSRRIKTEFLVQLDGATTDNEERILVIGATNRPQELDEAARRRFVKRLYIPLPDLEARLQLVTTLISKENHNLTETDFKIIAEKSEGFSGADMRNLCSEASLGPIRSIDLSMIKQIQPEQVRPLEMQDFEKAFLRVRSSVSSKDLDQYLVWDGTYGSGF